VISGSTKQNLWIYLCFVAFFLSACSTDEETRALPEVVQVERVVPYHIVSGGESVGSIAEKYSMTRVELIKLNRLSPPYQLYSGQRLVINVKVEDSSSSRSDPEVIVEEKARQEKREQDSGVVSGDGVEKQKLSSEERPSQETESDAPQIVEEDFDYVWPIADGQNKIVQNFKDSSDGEVILKASAGTPVKAITDGTVRIAKTLDGEAASYGKTVIILHNKKNKLSVYSHLQEYSVSVGQKVKKGAVIGKVGKSGNAKSTQLHLQVFDVNKKDKTRTPVDPEKILP
jgi:murein DD-endopeptidase MepM/ murein hydrolase activator NlpD